MSAKWTPEEEDALFSLFASGDKAPLPWQAIPERLNEEFGNARSLSACQTKLYSLCKRLRQAGKDGAE